MEASIQLNAILLCKLLRFFYPVSLHTIRPLVLLVRYFSYLTSYLFNFNIYVVLYNQLYQFILHFSRPICAISVRHRLVAYITPKESTLLWIWYHIFFCVTSSSWNNLFWFDLDNRLCLYCLVLLSYLSILLQK